jgi:hypothetical protein
MENDSCSFSAILERVKHGVELAEKAHPELTEIAAAVADIKRRLRILEAQVHVMQLRDMRK